MDLFEACRTGRSAVVSEVLKEAPADVHLRTEHGLTPLVTTRHTSRQPILHCFVLLLFILLIHLFYFVIIIFRV
jgi:hypothetical protein